MSESRDALQRGTSTTGSHPQHQSRCQRPLHTKACEAAVVDVLARDNHAGPQPPARHQRTNAESCGGVSLQTEACSSQPARSRAAPTLRPKHRAQQIHTHLIAAAAGLLRFGGQKLKLKKYFPLEFFSLKTGEKSGQKVNEKTLN